jgi:hypothetical protein
MTSDIESRGRKHTSWSSMGAAEKIMLTGWHALQTVNSFYW